MSATKVFVGGFVTIAVLGVVAMFSALPALFPSLGPTAFLLFAAPTAPASQPRNVLAGHAIGLVCGYLALVLTGLTDARPAFVMGMTVPRILAVAFSLAATSAAMVKLGVGHPPAGATTMIVSLGVIARPNALLVMEVSIALLLGMSLMMQKWLGIVPAPAAAEQSSHDPAKPQSH